MTISHIIIELSKFSSGLLLAERNKEWGYIGTDGEWKIPPRFEAAWNFEQFDMARVVANGSARFIDTSGRFVGSNRFDAICAFEPCGVAAVEKNGKWGIINRECKYITRNRFDMIRPFAGCGTAVFSNDDAYGYITSDGEILIEPRYSNARDFSECGFAAVKSFSRWQVIDRKGNINYAKNFDDVSAFSASGLAAASIDGKRGYINTEGEFVIEPEFRQAMEFYPQGIAWVRAKTGWGLIDAAGASICDAVYDEYDDNDFGKLGLFSVRKADKWGVINSSGQEIITPAFVRRLHIDASGFFADDAGGLRYITSDGHITDIVVPSFVPNSGRYVIVSRTGFRRGNDMSTEYGYINPDTPLLIPMQYDEVMPFCDGESAYVRFNGKWGRINTVGEWVSPPEQELLNDSRHVSVRAEHDRIVYPGSEDIPFRMGNYSVGYEYIENSGDIERHIVRANDCWE